MEQFSQGSPEMIDQSKSIEKEQLEFTRVFENYYKRIYNYIYYRVNCRYTAEDLTSIVFEKAMLNQSSYISSKASYEVWLFAIARNVVKDHYRRMSRRKFFSLDSISEMVSRDRSLDDLVLLSETNDKLFQALKILKEKERNIIALKFGGNLRNVEIAQVLRISESNVGVMLYRIMKKLKKEMESEG